jgi:DNA-directed RNA polymerase beta' subunit
MLSPEEIRRNSVVEVTSRDTYINNKPVIGGLFDPRMGVLEPGTICPTDGMTYIDTPGYFGHIELARPLFFMQHLKEIMKFCRCVCFKCSKLLINKNEYKHILDKRAEDRWDYVNTLATKIKRCGEKTDDGCGCKQPDKIKVEGMATIYAIWENIDSSEGTATAGAVAVPGEKGKIVIKLTPEIILKIFKRISDDDVYFMGFNPLWSRPEWMICQVLPVPPPAVRPSVKHDAQQRSEDDLTQIYINIIKTNNSLKEKLNSTEPVAVNVIEMWTSILQYSIAMIVNNKIKGADPMAQRSGRPLQCISGRINSKNGRIRGNLMGKRVDFSARSVITGDPNLSIQQLGVPMKIAKNITKPVMVNDLNRDFLMKLIQNGPEEYPGAKILERKSGENISLRYVDRASIHLENGDIVHRHMMDGDAVLFNRQPSLHRMSMMCHIVKVMKIGDTFRMNVGVTKPYNADFDGDEMNMHMPQSTTAEVELKHLAAIPYQIISPGGNAPIIGIFQDSLLGSYRFTRKNIILTPREAMNLLMMFPNVNVDALRKLGNKITSFDVLSQILPELTLKHKTKLFNEGEDSETSNNVLEIRNGKYIRGQIDKSVVGSATKGILHRICNDFGNMACSNFNDNLQNIVTEYMKTSSFSVGISDLIANQSTQNQILQILASKKLEVQTIMDKVHLGVFENNTAKTNMEEFELQVNNTLNKASDDSGEVGRKSLSKDNRFLMIVESGSKGSLLNISQMISCLGQQNIDGKRIPYGFDSRTLPHFSKFDDSPNARGFIENSYISGLTAPELFFHAMAGRIGLIDTAVKTSQTGYIQRKIVKGLEDLKVEYDMTVRNSKGKIIQFEYGEDGFDSMKVENQVLPLVGMSVEDIYMHYDIPGGKDSTPEVNAKNSVFTKSAINRMTKQKDKCNEKCKKYIDKMLLARDNVVVKLFKRRNENGIRMPIAFQYIISNIQGQLGLKSNSAVDITPLEAFELIEDYYRKLNVIQCIKTNPLFEIMYYYYLTPRDLLVHKRFHKKGLILLLENILLKFKESIVHPGEMVGVLAAQSVGEPATQLTLNSLVYEDLIVVRNSKLEITKISIGDFTEQQIKLSKKIEYMEDKDTTYAELPEFYEVPCATEEGETVWRRVEAVTRHPVINEDGTNTMLKVTTYGNREVTATKAKSFLQLQDGKILGVNGKDLNVGDYLPCSRKPLDYKETHILNLREMLPPTEYIYGTEIAKVKLVMGQHHWFKNNKGKTFILPHTRADSLANLFKEEIAENRKCTPNKAQYIKPGMVYMKNIGMCDYDVPEDIELNYEFGYLVGAYAAEGCMTKFQISISNNDPAYLLPIENLCKKWNITTKRYTHTDKNQVGWTSSDIRIYNTVLCKILENLCGKLSHSKFISPTIVFSNRECILGFLDAYIGGDGTICQYKKKNDEFMSSSVSVSSTSLEMITDVMVMLRNLGISGHIHKPKKQESNNRGTLSENIHQIYHLNIKNQQSQKLATILNLPIVAKQDKLQKLLLRDFEYEYSKSDLYLPNMINGVVEMEPRDGKMMDLEFDQIVSIEEVPNTTSYAYDLTVEDTRNFDLYNGMSVRDTFHSTGSGSKSNVTRGVPRIEEILRITKNPKNPSITAFLKPIDEMDKDKAVKYASLMEHTKLIDVVSSVQICFDPNDKTSQILEDELLLEQFYEFESMMKECIGGDNPAEPEPKSKWIIRMEFDAETLLDKNITMDDVHFAITNSSYGPDIHCVFADYNMDKLIFRIRTKATMFNKLKKKGVPESLDQSDEIYLLKNFQDTIINNIVLRGVNGIKNVQVRQNKNSVIKEDGKYTRKDTWILDTTGTNLLDTLALDYIDSTRTYSNDIREMFNVLGIEAARQNIHNELTEVMEFSDIYINYHHTSLLCDRMTCNKDMVAIFRSGLLSDNVGPIAKATFEVQTEVFLDAARHGEFDHMRGVSANIMCGQHGNYGTSAFQIVLDMKAMQELDSLDIRHPDKNVDEIMQGMEDPSVCSKKQIEIHNNVVNIKKTADATCTDNYDIGF